MNITRKFNVLAVVLIASLTLAACGGQATTQAPAATQAPANQPTALKFGIVMTTPLGTPWNASLLQALTRVKELKPHGLDISWDVSENVAQADEERVLRQYADSGKYGIIWDNGPSSEVVRLLLKDYPEILFAVDGAGNKPLGGNGYYFDSNVHECAYLLGIIAGKMTKTNTIGMIGQYAYPNVNISANAYFAGAKSVNPNIKTLAAYVDSWYDPVKTKQAAEVQIAAQADYIFGQSLGAFDAAKEKGVFVFGHQVDQNELGPDVVVTGDVIKWDPGLMTVIDAWWAKQTQNTAYAAPSDKGLIYNMKDGSCDLAPYHNFADKLPPDVKTAVDQAKADIMSGKLVVQYDESTPTSSK